MFVKRIFAIIVVIFIVIACVPVSVSAIDPVSSATMANALAQAITAYGASHGVSMTFDVANTNGIGQGMHELWDDFKDYVNDNNVPTYDSLANTMWASIYTKIGNYIGININDTEIPFIDAFWNWLLSGPAEMTRIDNSYYEWSFDNDDNVNPIIVNTSSTIVVNGKTCYSPPFALYDNSNRYLTYKVSSSSASQQVYYFTAKQYPESNGYWVWAFSADHNPFGMTGWLDGDAKTSFSVTSANSSNGYWYCWKFTVNYGQPIPSEPEEWNGSYIYDYLGQYNASNVGIPDTSNISVRPYVGDAVPQDVYIPDNEDVNYSPLPYVGGIDIPWDDSLFGDGTGTLTDAQSEAISGVIDNSITDSLEKTLTLADTDNPDMPAPNEVYIPFLPVALPNFNFSLSGIWHYVREWIASLGAWFTMVLTIWANLPYAIIVPVYATMVILIVLGVYKRFFM